MSDQLVTPRCSAVPRGRANGFVSAVLLVLLLATAGWPVDTATPVAGEHVACQVVGSARHVARAEESAERAAKPRASANTAARPRPLPRQRRVDSYGLPPPRAPTA